MDYGNRNLEYMHKATKMAGGDSRFEKVREELICAICLDFLREPKVLQCAHSFCQQCLERMVATQGLYKIAKESPPEGELACPTCRHVTCLPGGKVAKLRTNFNLKRLVDIVSEDEKARTRITIRRRGSTRPTIDRSNQSACPVHQKPLEYFCADCNELLCRKCMIAGHRDHNYKDVDEVLPEQLAALHSLIQPACEVSSQAESMMEKLFKDREMVGKNCADTSHAVKAFFAKTREVLNQREKALLSTIQKYSDVKLTKFDIHYHKLLENRKAILRLVDSIEKLLQQSRVEDVSMLTEKRTIAEELDVRQQSVLSIQDVLIESKSAHAFLSFKEDYRFLHPLSEIGTLNECRREPDSVFLSMRRVVVTEDEDPYLDVPLRFEDVGPAGPQQVVRVDETQPEILSKFADDDNDTYDTPRPVPPLPKKDLPVPNGGVASVPRPPHRPKPLPAIREETYDVPRPLAGPSDVYDVPKPVTRPVVPPRKTLPATPPSCSIKSGENDPEDSDDEYEPFILPPTPKPRTRPPPLPPNHPNRPVKPVPKPRSTTLQRSASSETADVLSVANKEALTEEKRRRSKTLPPSVFQYPPALPLKVNPDIVQPIMVLGCEQLSWPFGREMVYPCGVCCMTLHDTLVVTDVFNHCVRLIDVNGKFIEKIGREGRSGGQFKEPGAVAVSNNDEHIFVVERDNPRVQKFNSMGKYILKFGQKALWGSQLTDPWGVALAFNGNIYVSDWEKNRIYVFQSNGKCVNTIGKDDGFIKFPAGITFDRRGRLLVTDRGNHCVWVLTPEGELVEKIGRLGQLHYPYGVAVKQDGTVIVTESGDSRVAIFSPTGEFLRHLGGPGSEPGLFNHPRHVCVNSKGHVIIADEMNQRIQIFQL